MERIEKKTAVQKTADRINDSWGCGNAFRVALLGKTNVGKSSLFNALVGKNKAIVSPKKHVTRDAIFSYLPLATFEKKAAFNARTKKTFEKSLAFTAQAQHSAQTNTNSRQLQLMDLAGIYFPDEPLSTKVKSDFEKQLIKRLHNWISGAQLLMVVVDLYNIGHDDVRIFKWLQKEHPTKKLHFVVNKWDSDRDEGMMGEVFSWKVSQPLWVSAKTGRGLADLRSFIAKKGRAWFVDKEKEAEQSRLRSQTSQETSALPLSETKIIGPDKQSGEKILAVEESKRPFSVSILGKPNAGKSSLLNALLKAERALVSDMPGTTRDAIDEEVLWGGNRLRFIDTAGMRRKARVRESVETLSVMKAVRAVDDSELSLLLIDASEPISEQDKKIAALAAHHEKALLIVFNKWDLVSQDWPKFIDRQLFLFPLLKNFLLMPLSVKNGFHFSLLKKKILEVKALAEAPLQTSVLNKTMMMALEKNSPPIIRKNQRAFSVKYLVQTSSFPVVLRAFCARKAALTSAYETYLLNTFRKKLGLQGLPLKIIYDDTAKSDDAADSERKRKYLSKRKYSS